MIWMHVILVPSRASTDMDERNAALASDGKTTKLDLSRYASPRSIKTVEEKKFAANVLQILGLDFHWIRRTSMRQKMMNKVLERCCQVYEPLEDGVRTDNVQVVGCDPDKSHHHRESSGKRRRRRNRKHGLKQLAQVEENVVLAQEAEEEPVTTNEGDETNVELLALFNNHTLNMYGSRSSLPLPRGGYIWIPSWEAKCQPIQELTKEAVENKNVSETVQISLE